MHGFSILMPCEKNRFDLLSNTLDKYKEFGIPEGVEFIIISRTLEPKVTKHFRIIKYDWEGKYFSSALPLNIGVRNAKYNNIIVTCPEVMPLTNVLKQLSDLPDGNYVCQVFDEFENGDKHFSLVNSNFRSFTPAMYFLACFQKSSLEAINGWDEDFMGTYSYEDDDFGERFMRAGLHFEMRDEIQALHQYHPRGRLGQDGGASQRLLFENNTKGIIRPRNGLVKL